MQQESKARSLWSKMTFRRSVSDSGSELGSDVNAVIGGIPACIFGQFGEIAVFMEPLLDAQIQSLFKLGMTGIFLLVCETEIALWFSINFVLHLLLVTWHTSFCYDSVTY